MLLRMFPHTVTLYIPAENEPPNITILRGVLLDELKASSVNVRGHDGADGPRLYVPMSVTALDGLTGESKAYTDPVSYERAEDKAGLWTFPADGMAFFTKGKVVEPDKTRQELEAAHDGVYTIVSVAERDFGSPGLRHWQIGGA